MRSQTSLVILLKRSVIAFRLSRLVPCGSLVPELLVHHSAQLLIRHIGVPLRRLEVRVSEDQHPPPSTP